MWPQPIQSSLKLVFLISTTVWKFKTYKAVNSLQSYDQTLRICDHKLKSGQMTASDCHAYYFMKDCACSKERGFHITSENRQESLEL